MTPDMQGMAFSLAAVFAAVVLLLLRRPPL